MRRDDEHWGDDDRERPDRRRTRGGMSPAIVVLVVVGSMFLVVAVGCGGLMYLGYRKARDSEAAAHADRVIAEARQADAERMQGRPAEGPLFGPNLELVRPPEDVVPPPKPGFQAAPEPPPQPRATAFATDDGINPNRWRVLFRSRKPDLWNTNTQNGDDFAIPLQSTPADTRYLRLRRMDNGEAIIIPFSRDRIGRADPAGPKVRWNGEGKEEHGGFHLGIAEGPVARFTEGKGTIGVLMDGWDANPGSGFGHAHHIENGGQRFSWKGMQIQPTAFEVAVTTGELTQKEREWLRE